MGIDHSLSWVAVLRRRLPSAASVEEVENRRQRIVMSLICLRTDPKPHDAEQMPVFQRPSEVSTWNLPLRRRRIVSLLSQSRAGVRSLLALSFRPLVSLHTDAISKLLAFLSWPTRARTTILYHFNGSRIKTELFVPGDKHLGWVGQSSVIRCYVRVQIHAFI